MAEFFVDKWWLWIIIVAVALILIASYSRRNLSNRKSD